MAVGTLAGAGDAEAATATRKVVQQVPRVWTYNARTKVTTVKSFRTVKVTARFSGSSVYLQNSHRTWVRVPYVWSSRRKALVFSRALQLALIAAARPKATPKPAAPPPLPDPTSTNPYLASAQARHVLNRAGYGPSTAALADVAAAGGAAAWLEKQLTPSAIDDSACEAVLSRLPNQADPVWLVMNDIRTDVRNGYDQNRSVGTSHAIRAAFSRRQLLTVMEEFWANHFNVTIPNGDVESSRSHYQYMLRTKALGTFTDLLRTASMHPAMLTYLNNRDSDALHPNENQGRELLELHTVGVDAGYGEDGVLNSARILTGLSVEWESGEFEYKPWDHWVGPVHVLGFSHANATVEGGKAVAEAYFDYLARHPATAARLARKLATRFVSDTPSDALVASLAQVYLTNSTAIVPVLRALFASQEFKASIGHKTKRPFESVISTVRMLDLGPDATDTAGPEALTNLASDAGQYVFGAPYPTGWPDVESFWSSTATTLNRWSATRDIVSGWYPSTLTRLDLRGRVLPGTLPQTHGEALDVISHSLFGLTLAPAHKAAVLTFLGKGASDLVAGSPLVSYLLDDVVALLLDSPYHHYR